MYRIARNFRGLKFSRFSRINDEPRKFYPPKFYLRCARMQSSKIKSRKVWARLIRQNFSPRNFLAIRYILTYMYMYIVYTVNVCACDSIYIYMYIQYTVFMHVQNTCMYMYCNYKCTSIKGISLGSVSTMSGSGSGSLGVDGRLKQECMKSLMVYIIT